MKLLADFLIVFRSNGSSHILRAPSQQFNNEPGIIGKFFDELLTNSLSTSIRSAVLSALLRQKNHSLIIP